MRKLSIIILALAVAGLWAIPAAAGITGTSHELTADGGPCASCHLPHGATGGTRLWPKAPVSGTPAGMIGVVAPLCAYCHHTSGGAYITAAGSDNYVWGSQSHGVMMTSSTPPYSYTGSGLEYHLNGSDGQIECTTCHNVHDDPTGTATTGFRPFLRANLNTLCSGCHMNRRYEAGAFVGGNSALLDTVWNWGLANVGLANPGSHPVGTSFSTNASGGVTPITFPLEMNVALDNVTDGWTLGGHRTGGASGGVVCTTCHAVHGLQYDAQGTGFADSTLNDRPNPNFLAIYQTANMTDPDGRSIANGHQDYNALCEACHVGTDPATAYGVASYLTTWYNPNPGGTSYGHPVDGMNVTDTTWVTAFSGYPYGGTGSIGYAGSIGTPLPICESCHVMHPTANAGQARADEGTGNFGASDYILRNSAFLVCNDCHTGSIAGHHPVAITFNVPGGSPLGYLANITVGGDNLLSCGTCHTGGSGAHNWDGFGRVDLDPSWLPSDNGRAATIGGERYNAQLGITCMDCHYGVDGVMASRNPTLNDGLNANYLAPNEDGTAFAIIGTSTGTHYIGLIAKTWGTDLGALENPETAAWTSTYGGVGGYSRFGGSSGTTVVVCESCHELQPDKNTSAHLLLGTFGEEQGVASNRSTFCEFCHLPPGTHPMTGDTVSRTGQALDTNTTKAWLDTPPTDTNILLMNNRINCDSCHQVHNASDESYTFILDSDASMIGTATALDPDPTSGNYTGTYVTDIQSVRGGDHNRFCNECHPYN